MDLTEEELLVVVKHLMTSLEPCIKTFLHYLFSQMVKNGKNYNTIKFLLDNNIIDLPNFDISNLDHLSKLEYNDTNILKLFFENNKFDINKILDQVLESGHVSILKILIIDSKLVIDLDKNYILTTVVNNDIEKLIALLSCPNYFDPSMDNNNALSYALRKSHFEIVIILLKHITNTISEDIVKEIFLTDNDEIIKNLIHNSYFDPSIMDNCAIIWASRKGYDDIVEFLLKDKRTNPTIGNNICIFFASENYKLTTLFLLLNDKRICNNINIDKLLNLFFIKKTCQRLFLVSQKLSPTDIFLKDKISVIKILANSNKCVINDNAIFANVIENNYIEVAMIIVKFNFGISIPKNFWDLFINQLVKKKWINFLKMILDYDRCRMTCSYIKNKNNDPILTAIDTNNYDICKMLVFSNRYFSMNWNYLYIRLIYEKKWIDIVEYLISVTDMNKYKTMFHDLNSKKILLIASKISEQS